ncbi:MAG TPA: reactive intermediate/imine deaminase [Candidatus Marinimicrobia bacterium]|nr:Rid family detoxifying hydrolase [Candidatus Neomarinimicrobiota bacterium]PCH59629.1 MAG: reactive intermediate/imine deaminase [Candidatus Neomarinimicrobiota bacterium]HIB14744.1 reactive intermediate/imine deaminase [Candidatus Neomarinimicrobiota bacterium]HIM53708.1 reactive intermediate/imine deaminase [Candidatus Neomarinimicrobiota bacterium]HIN20111.1 reactive intermediate/imine deaminase [Candidatus Neomarinimicrobiota bacterium]
MDKVVIHTTEAPKAIGTYSQGIKSDNFVFTSGQIPINPQSGELIKGDFKSEVKQVLINLNGVLKGGGSSLQQAIKLTVFLTDLSHFAQVNEIFNEFFPDNPPARSAVQVSALPMNARIEIDAVGHVE